MPKIADTGAAAALTLIAHSRSARAASARLIGTLTETRRRVEDGRRTALAMTTAAVDRGRSAHPVMSARLAQISSRSNRKLRDVAQQMLGSRDGRSRPRQVAAIRG